MFQFAERLSVTRFGRISLFAVLTLNHAEAIDRTAAGRDAALIRFRAFFVLQPFAMFGVTSCFHTFPFVR
jgi:hypothetical protein